MAVLAWMPWSVSPVSANGPSSSPTSSFDPSDPGQSTRLRNAIGMRKVDRWFHRTQFAWRASGRGSPSPGRRVLLHSGDLPQLEGGTCSSRAPAPLVSSACPRHWKPILTPPCSTRPRKAGAQPRPLPRPVFGPSWAWSRPSPTEPVTRWRWNWTGSASSSSPTPCRSRPAQARRAVSILVLDADAQRYAISNGR